MDGQVTVERTVEVHPVHRGYIIGRFFGPAGIPIINPRRHVLTPTTRATQVDTKI